VGYKIKHYAKPVSTDVTPLWESALIEFSIGLICTGVAFWSRDIVIQLFVGCTIIAAVCFLLSLQNIFVIFRTRAMNRKLKADESLDKT